jgi:hypothetical protein
LQRGWQCPGYGKHIRWSAKHERFGPLSSASHASPSSGLPVQQPLQALYRHDWQYSGQDGPSRYPSTGSRNADLSQEQVFEEVLPSELPITPVSPCTFDQSISVKNQQLRSNHSTSTVAPTYNDAVIEQDHCPITHGTIDSQHTINKAFASPTSNSTLSRSSRQEDFFDPRIFYTPTHIPTILVEHWFSDVCPMWNIFDSDSNFNRQFASSSWSSSEPVFYAMQSMSAACLVDTLPAMMPVLSSLTSTTLTAIKSRVSFFKDTQHTALPEFPTDLLFAIFAMGTSLHWKHGFELGGSLMKYAHYVIDRYKKRLPAMAPSERQHLAFFQKALICWEGILSAADMNFTPASFVVRRQAYQKRITSSQIQMPSPQPHFGPLALSLSDVELHPWCGVSSDVLQKFGQVMTLCHLAQRRRHSTIESDKLAVDCDLGLAQELASELAAMDFTLAPQHECADDQHLETNDNDTPLAHLLGIAEAYRQACFLQLCLTFEDLPIHATGYTNLGLSLDANPDDFIAYGLTRAQDLVGLSLQLVEGLKKIPPESGSRCMQPLLYLCAASGLQFNPLPSPMIGSAHLQVFTQGDIESFRSGTCGNLRDCALSEGSLGESSESSAFSSQEFNTSHVLTVSAFKVAQARSFVKKRLGMLQQLLPPRYTGTALRLAEAIWAEYDCTLDGGSPLYWFDVMVREKLQTFFG